jgi:phage repressor protein C with HTH and peptisase S24 domain
MSWATYHIEKLSNGETVKFRPRGHSMQPRIESGQLVTVRPCVEDELSKGDIVLCKVNGRQYLHKISAVGPDGRFQISNNKGHINGWISFGAIYGLCVEIES